MKIDSGKGGFFIFGSKTVTPVNPDAQYNDGEKTE